MSKIIGFLIIMGGIAGIYFVYQDYAAQQKLKNNHWADDLRLVIKSHSTDASAADAGPVSAAEETAYFRMLGVMYASERHGFSAGETVKNGFSGSGLRPGESKMAADLLMENYRTAKQLGVFNSTQNVLKLERGESPVCDAKGWEDEPLSLGHVLSPVVAPEASLSLANMVLMPRVMRDMQNEDLTGFSPELAKKWLSERIIKPETHSIIMEKLLAKKF